MFLEQIYFLFFLLNKSSEKQKTSHKKWICSNNIKIGANSHFFDDAMPMIRVW